MKVPREKGIAMPGAPISTRPTARWLQRFGAVGFAFFLIKGLLWLTVPALLAYLGYR